MAGPAFAERSHGLQRISVFLDYQFLYHAARDAFAAHRGSPPAPWFGNFVPELLAQAAIVTPPPWRKRSERQLARVHVVVPQVTPESSPRAATRVDEWRRDGLAVREAPRLAAPSWRIARAVALVVEVAEALHNGECDAIVVGAGEPGLLPLVRSLVGGRREEARVELVAWVAPGGQVVNPLAAAAPEAWCHRFGATTFERVADRGRPRSSAFSRMPILTDGSSERGSAAARGGAPEPIGTAGAGEIAQADQSRDIDQVRVRRWGRWVRKGRRETQ